VRLRAEGSRRVALGSLRPGELALARQLLDPLVLVGSTRERREKRHDIVDVVLAQREGLDVIPFSFELAQHWARGVLMLPPLAAALVSTSRSRPAAVVREAASCTQAQGPMSIPRFDRVRDRFSPTASPLPGVVEPHQSRVAATARSH